jgi:hypothetical protein
MYSVCLFFQTKHSSYESNLLFNRQKPLLICKSLDATAVQIAMINHENSGAVIVRSLLVVLVAYAKKGPAAGKGHLPPCSTT